MKFLLCLLAVLPLARSTPGKPDEYFDVLGQGHREWRLVFRGTAHTNQPVYVAYSRTNTTQGAETACRGVDFTKGCSSHYRNDDAMDNWSKVKDVLFGIVKDGKIVKTLRFNGTGSNTENWFSGDKLIDPCYKDLASQTNNNFNLRGEVAKRRRFLINRPEKCCKGSQGWFVAIDRKKRECSWELRDETYPVFLFSAGQTATAWRDGRGIQADAFVIFVNYHPFAGTDGEFFDLFNSGKREWRFAFRATADVGSPTLGAYLHGQGIPSEVDDGCKSTDWSADCKSHYRNNDALDNYDAAAIDKVLFGVIDYGALVKTITFDASGTTMDSWFQKGKVLDSCWSDFHAPVNYFGVQGHLEYPRVQRSFFASHKYQGCPNDVGWAVSVDNPRKPPCPWELSESIPFLLYAAGQTMGNWNTLNRGGEASSSVRQAEAFVVFIKYKTFPL